MGLMKEYKLTFTIFIVLYKDYLKDPVSLHAAPSGGGFG